MATITASRIETVGASTAFVDLPFVQGFIDGMAVDMLLDSGASVSLIRRNFIKQATIQPVNVPVCLKNATGAAMRVLGTITTEVSMCESCTEHTFYVVAELIYPIIIGVDFFRKHQVSMQFTGTKAHVQFPKSVKDVPQATFSKSSEIHLPRPSIETMKIKTTAAIFSDERKARHHGLPIMTLDATLVNDERIEEEISIPTRLRGNVELPDELPTAYQSLFQEFSELFIDRPGKTSIASHKIRTIDDLPVRVPPRRIPAAYRGEVEKQLQAMLAEGIITPSDSAFTAPCVFAMKKNGEVRICVDYRELNKRTVKDAYPLPLPDEIQERLQGDAIFSTLDLRSGYWQIPVAEKDQHKTAFCPGHEYGLFEFKRMPFGLTGAPATFQRAMNTIFRGLPFVSVYLDDILVHSKDQRSHLENLREVFHRLSKSGLTIRGAKCAIGKSQVTYLGHVYSAGGTKPDPNKISAIASWPIPKDAKELQRFLGLANYYRRFVAGYARIAEPLHQMTHKEAPFLWNEMAGKAFTLLKERLCADPILHHPRNDKTFVVATDASDKAIGAVLEQEGRAIVFASRLLRGAEERYSVVEKECLALVFALKQFRHFVLGRKFEVLTDHKPLQWLQSHTDNPRICRWALSVQEFDFKITHISGKSNQVADALSRKVCTTQRNFHISREDVKNSQKNDPTIKRIFQAKQAHGAPNRELNGFEATALKRIWGQIRICDGILVREQHDETLGSTKNVPIIGKQLRKEILGQFHDSTVGGHFGIDKTFERCQNECYWPRMYSYVRKYCNSCTKCQEIKLHSARPPLQPITVGKPWSLVGVDVLEVPTSRQGNKYLIVYQDYFSKWPEVYATKDQSASTVVKTLMDLVSRFGPPEQLHSDQGTNFESRILSDTLQFFGIRKSRTTTYHPQGNGLVERMNRSLLTLFRSFVEGSHNWEDTLGPVLYAYRTATHTSTGFSPYEIMFARNPPAMIENNSAEWGYDTEDWVKITCKKYLEIQKRVHENIKQAQSNQKRQHDKHTRDELLRVGDEVWLLQIRRLDKLSPRWQRNWFVIKILTDQTLVIRNKEGEEKVVNKEKVRKLVLRDRVEDTTVDHQRMLEEDSDTETQEENEDLELEEDADTRVQVESEDLETQGERGEPLPIQDTTEGNTNDVPPQDSTIAPTNVDTEVQRRSHRERRPPRRFIDERF